MSLRAQKVQELIKEELNNIFLREFEFGKDKLVTITKVEVTNDLKNAKAWISVLPFTESKSVITTLNKAKKHIYHLLMKKIRLRGVPTLRFVIDETEENASFIEEELNNIT